MLRPVLGALVGLAAFAIGGSANAVVVGSELPVIDTFETPVFVSEPSRFSSGTFTQTAPAGAIGDRRVTISATWGSGNSILILAGIAAFKTTGDDTVFMLEYGVSNPLDLVLPGDAFKFSVLESDLDNRGITAPFTTTLVSGDGVVESATIQLGGEGEYIIPFSLFDLTDLNDVDYIAFALDMRGILGGRVRIGEIVDPILPGETALSEPATFTLIGFGLLGLAGLARRRRA